MKHAIKAALSCAFACLLTACMATAAFAEMGNVTYQGKAAGFIFAPGSEYSPTDLFANLKNVLPGDSIAQDIVVKNTAGEKVNVRVYVRSLGAQEGTDAFLNQLTLEVAQTGGDELFDAPAGQTAQLTEWTYLGTLAPGATTQLTATLAVPLDMDNAFQAQVGYVDWEFAVEEVPVAPQTGDTMMLVVAGLGVVAVLAVVLAALAARARRRRTR